jgi:hypothetical protein
VTHSNQSILIKAALFDDGTYEGDVLEAAQMSAYRTGEKIVIPRLIAELNKALTAKDTEVSESIRALEAALASVSNEIDRDQMQALLSRFPRLGKLAAEQMSVPVNASLAGTKAGLIKQLRLLESESPDDANAYRNWLLAEKALYEQWLARL